MAGQLRPITKHLNTKELSDILYQWHNSIVDRKTGTFSCSNYEQYMAQVCRAVNLYPEFRELQDHLRFLKEYAQMYKAELTRSQ